jgi:hypothetical protein
MPLPDRRQGARIHTGGVLDPQHGLSKLPKWQAKTAAGRFCSHGKAGPAVPPPAQPCRRRSRGLFFGKEL